MDNQISVYFGKRLSAIREALELKQAAIGEILGCSLGAFSLYELNKRQPPLSVLFRLSDRFGVSIDYLLGCFTPFPEQFSDRLSEVLAERPEKSLTKFCALVDLDPSAAKLLISGRCFPNSKVLKSLCSYLNCSVDFLIGNSDCMVPSDNVIMTSTAISRNSFDDLSPDRRDKVLEFIEFQRLQQEKDVLARKQEA